MLALLVGLVILCVIVYIARAVLAGLGAPGWLFQILVGIAIIVAIVMVANAFGVATPKLNVPYDPGFPEGVLA